MRDLELIWNFGAGEKGGFFQSPPKKCMDFNAQNVKKCGSMQMCLLGVAKTKIKNQNPLSPKTDNF